MAKRPDITEAAIRRRIKAGRAEDPRAVVEIVHDGITTRYLPEPVDMPQTPYDEWRSKRDARHGEGH